MALFHGVSVLMRTVYMAKSIGRAGLTGAQLLQRHDINVSSSENKFCACAMPFNY
jgi:hypothetical protein